MSADASMFITHAHFLFLWSVQLTISCFCYYRTCPPSWARVAFDYVTIWRQWNRWVKHNELWRFNCLKGLLKLYGLISLTTSICQAQSLGNQISKMRVAKQLKPCQDDESDVIPKREVKQQDIFGEEYLQPTLWNTSRYLYLDISDLRNRGKNKSNNHISQINL